MSNLQEAALYYASLGYKVFPCKPGGKKPITKHGCKDATNDPDEIEKLWKYSPSANVAISTDGLLVVDVDGHGFVRRVFLVA